jgi:hypothetical protein
VFWGGVVKIRYKFRREKASDMVVLEAVG